MKPPSETAPSILQTKHHRRPAEQAELSRRIETLSGEGYTQAEIANELQVSIGTVNRYIQPFIKRLNDEICAVIDNEFSKMLLKIDALERRYYEGWEASQATGPGNPRFLRGILRCIAWRCKMLGLYK